MGPKPLWKRAVALLAAVGMSVFLAGGISADDEIAEAEPAAALQPTQVVAEIPTEYDTPFQLQWGGGSLFQLKARLATMGCMANNIWIHNNNQWSLYNQYTLSHNLFFIQQFLQQYENNIPAGTLWADCYRICEFKYIHNAGVTCRTFEIQQRRNFGNILPYPIGHTSLCTDDFDPLVKEQVLPHLPLHPDTCIVRQENERVSGYYMHFFVKYGNIYPNSVPIIVVYAPADYVSPNLPPATQQKNKARLLHFEIHELCHVNQDWYVAQALQPNNALSARPNDLWYSTPAGKEFIALTGFTKNNTGDWTLPRNSVYSDIYSIDPSELSAELCMSYILEHIDIKNSYHSLENFNLNTYLTPEIRQWLETYMILPEISEEDAG